MRPQDGEIAAPPMARRTRFPLTLEGALERFVASKIARNWFTPRFIEVYRLHKLGEMAFLRDRTEAEICAAYEAAY